jgi:hypothetical protein
LKQLNASKSPFLINKVNNLPLNNKESTVISILHTPEAEVKGEQKPVIILAYKL